MRVDPTRRGRIAVALAAALAGGGAQAAELDLADSDWAVRFDNTLKGGLMYRTQNADPALVDSFRLLVPGVPASAFGANGARTRSACAAARFASSEESW